MRGLCGSPYMVVLTRARSALRLRSPNTGLGAGCYAASCASASQLVITIGPSQGASASSTVVCTAASSGVGMSVGGYVGVIVCPDVVTLCGPGERFDPS
jgi:hypothetical protein